jgi:hypothetical protein
METYKGCSSDEFERQMKEYLKQGKEKLEKDLSGTREAIKLIAVDKTRDFVNIVDKGFEKEERDFLVLQIITCMYQSFCYGYGIGKMEGRTSNKVYL